MLKWIIDPENTPAHKIPCTARPIMMVLGLKAPAQMADPIWKTMTREKKTYFGE
jgi:hypothetical protein